MAIAERRLAAEFNRPGHTIVDHWTYAICSDGDLQEGIASEAASLAGHLQARQARDALRRQPDPARRPDRAWRSRRTSSSASGRTAGRPCGSRTAPTSAPSRPPSAWPAPTTGRRSSPCARSSASARRTRPAARRPTARRSAPTRSASPRRPTAGTPTGASSSRTPRPPSSPGRSSCGEELSRRWNAAFDALPGRLPGRGAASCERRLDGDLATGWDAALPRWEAGAEVATRNASADTINALAAGVPELFGGSADLSESNLTDVKGGGDFSAEYGGPQPPLRRPRARHGRDRQRPRLPRRLPAVRRDVPHLLRLHARQRPRGRPVRPPRRSTTGPTTRWAWARTGPPTSRSSITRPCGRSRTSGSSGRPTRTRPRPPGRSPSSGRDGPTALALTRQKLPVLPGTPDGARAGVRRGGYVVRAASTEAGRRRARPRLRRHRLRGPAGRRGRRGPRGRGDRDPRRQPPLLGGLRGPGRGLPRERPPGSGAEARRRRDRASRSAGSAGPATRGRSSPSTTSARRRPRARSCSEFGFTADAVAAIGRRVVREGFRGRVAAPPVAPPGRRPLMRVALRRRPRRRRAQGGAPRPPRRRRPRADRPRRRRLRPDRRLPGLRPPPGARDPRRRGGPRDPRLRLRDRGQRRGQQGPRRPGGDRPRHLLGPPGRRARRHERPLPRRPGHRPGARRRVRPGLPRRRASPARSATPAASPRCSRSRPRTGRSRAPRPRDAGVSTRRLVVRHRRLTSAPRHRSPTRRLHRAGGPSMAETTLPIVRPGHARRPDRRPGPRRGRRRRPRPRDDEQLERSPP